MGSSLVPFKVNLPAVTEEKLNALEEVAKGSEFLPRIQLVTKGKYVDESKIAPGHWGVPQPGGDEIIDLGDSIDVIPFDCRAKALDVSDRDAIVSVYDIKASEFQRIKSAPKNSGCMWGPSFLVLERSTGKLYELFFGNKSGRNEAGKLRPFLPTAANEGNASPATLGIRYKKTPEYGWHVPVITKCSEPFDPKLVKVDEEAILAEMKKFQNPDAGAEKVSEEEAKTSKRAR
jgi:hypothetical protein